MTGVDHPILLFLVLAILSLVSQRRRLDLLLDLVHLKVYGTLKRVKLPGYEAAQSLDQALPGLKSIFLVLLVHLDCEEEHIFLLFLQEVAGVVAEDLKLRPSRKCFLVLRDLVERVAHDSDQHVQHRDLREESCHDEQDPDEEHELVVQIHLSVKIAERDQVLIEQHVRDQVVGLVLEETHFHV